MKKINISIIKEIHLVMKKKLTLLKKIKKDIVQKVIIVTYLIQNQSIKKIKKKMILLPKRKDMKKGKKEKTLQILLNIIRIKNI